MQDAPLLVSLPPASRGQHTGQRTPEGFSHPLHSFPLPLPACESLSKARMGADSLPMASWE